MNDALAIPDFLFVPKGSRKPIFHRRRWRLPPLPHPAEAHGAKWEEAERWEITIPRAWSDRGGGIGAPAQIGSGRRLVWALIGRKWVELRDAEGYAKVPAPEWGRIAIKGRKLS